MTLETARLRAYVAHEIGCRLEDSLESAKAEVTRWEGASNGLREGAKAIEALLAHVDKDIDEGKYDLPTGAAIKLYVNRASQICTNLSVQASTHRAVASGSVSMGEQNVKVIKKFHEEELRKANAIAAAEAEAKAAGKSPGEAESASLRERPVGVHPPASIKQQRLAEEAAQRLAEEAAATSSVPPSVAVTPVAVAPPVPAPPVPAPPVPAPPVPAPPANDPPAQTWTLEEIASFVKEQEVSAPVPAESALAESVPVPKGRPIRRRRPVPVRVPPQASPNPAPSTASLAPPSPNPAPPIQVASATIGPARKKPGPKPGSKKNKT